MPPARAIAMAIRDSVTVSMAELTRGTLQPNVLGELAGGVGGRRDHIGGSGKQQNVVEGQSQHRDLLRIVTAGDYGFVREAANPRIRGDDQVAAAFETGQAR